jgi:hypothetical protein
LGARHKGAHAIYHLPDEGIEVIRVITHPEDTPRGWLTAHCRVKGRFADPFDLVVASLVGLSADELFFGLRWNYTSHDYKDAVQAACAINKSNPARIMKKAEAAAAKFVRDEIAPELTGHGLPLGKCEAYNRVYDQFYQSR